MESVEALRRDRPVDEGQLTPPLVEEERTGQRKWTNRVPGQSRHFAGTVRESSIVTARQD